MGMANTISELFAAGARQQNNFIARVYAARVYSMKDV